MINKLVHKASHSIFIMVTCFSILVISQAQAGPQSPLKTESVTLRQMIKVPADGKYRAVYNIHSDKEAAGINKGLYYARGLIEAFEKQGVKPAQLDLHLVLHGGAAKSLLIDDTYQMVSDDPFTTNTNAKVVEDLINLGVSVEICHSAMKSHGWTEKDVLPHVLIVHDGYTRLIKLQNDGYAYIGGF